MCVLKLCEELISEGIVGVTTFVILLALFGMLAEERLLVKWGFPRRDVGCATGVVRADEWVSGEEVVLSCRQDKLEVAVLAPAAGTLDRRLVCGYETMHVSDGAVSCFPWLLGVGWGRESSGNGVERLGVRHVWLFSLVANC